MKINYRPEIDGLRAIAVSSVILYHAQITLFGIKIFSGGFLGVDIFFVISGYLITSIIYKEIKKTGSFDFKYFYERRIRRILPVLLFVILTFIPFAWLFLLPISVIEFSNSIFYSLGFSSNLFFHFNGLLYGAENNLLIPFLHTWSLSVEEQYYIIAPFLILYIFKNIKKYFQLILIVLFFLSLFLAEYSSKNYPSISFYFIHTRMWELLIGSLLAFSEIKHGHRCNNKILNLTLPIVGTIILLFCFFLFNDNIYHPSFYTLIPITGTCFIIWSSNKKEIINQILSSKIFVGVGLISYSLYLWHYPVFAFSRITGFTDGLLHKKILLGLIILLLSLISYFVVEKPARNKKNKFKYVFKIILGAFILIFLFNLNVLLKKGKIDKINTFIEENFPLRPPFKSECKFQGDSITFLKDDLFKKKNT